MYPPIALLSILLLLLHPTTLALILPAPAHLTPPFPLPSTTSPTLNTSSNFLGIECYHLQPYTIDLTTCQPLFAAMLRSGGGDVYAAHQYGNGWRFRKGAEPCTITLLSPERTDRRVSVSVADVVVYATEVLGACCGEAGPGAGTGTGTGTGGANTFRGRWRVAVSRFPLDGQGGGWKDG
ncbi:MAG: hypothetical protein ALECFALPRED_009141 [Alectoria fallacina]|uniref:Uncharacterized protein n=1 Tax=Alectoria fallacina TaxID=1903189 RepID=A0A8H3J630_9LECA|nr:MAG: hypothetical protein ALECFALPRED_009141 [Alectoria fallacina]